MLPKVKFSLNKELDKQMIGEFLGMKSAGVDFGSVVVDEHKQLRGFNRADTEAIGEYCDLFYERNILELEDKLGSIEAEWRNVENQYFSIASKLFPGVGFPTTKYLAFLSIINCNPRFVPSNSFQIYWQTQEAVRIIAHELMHFSFFFLCEKEFKKLFKDESADGGGVYWTLSELFNNIVLGDSSIFGSIGGILEWPYPDHEIYIEPLKEIWDNYKQPEEFIPKAHAALINMNQEWAV